MKYLLTLVLGVLVGGAASYFLFVGAPRAGKLKGEPVGPPDASGPPPGTAVVELDEQFFKTLLDSIFRDLNKPAFPPAGGEGCQNRIVVEPNAGDVQTGVILRDGRVVVPMAFTGTYSLLTCQNLSGKAEAGIDFRFAPEEQTLYGELNVTAVDVAGIPPVLGGGVTTFVQGIIRQRVGQFPLLRGQQLSFNIPIEAAGGTLRAQARDVRPEVKDGRLRLYVTYDFTGAKGAATAPPPG